jgi:hypothetical protein
MVINLCKKPDNDFMMTKLAIRTDTNLKKWWDQNVIWIIKLIHYNKHSSKRRNIERCLSRQINERII